MAIRLYRAYSPGTRTKSVSYFDDLSKVKSERTLTFGKKACGGRNNRGVITVKGRGGGHKRKYRVIDFQRKSAVSAKVATIEYDPNRNARIALLQYKDGSKRYILSPRSLRLGMEVSSERKSWAEGDFRCLEKPRPGRSQRPLQQMSAAPARVEITSCALGGHLLGRGCAVKSAVEQAMPSAEVEHGFGLPLQFSVTVDEKPVIGGLAGTWAILQLLLCCESPEAIASRVSETAAEKS